MLQIAFLMVGLFLAYQLVVTLLQPVWIVPVTDWLRALLAWPGLVVVVLASLWFTRTGQPIACSWWLVSAGLLSYAVARTIWLVQDLFLFSYHVPFPSWSDLFFVLQYPFFLLALLLVPRVRPGIVRVRDVLDACLLLGAALALSWYFLLAPLYQISHETLLGKLVNLSYPVGSLAILFGLTVTLLRERQYEIEGPVLALLIAAIACLVVADSWAATFLLNASSYQTGSPPDLFWMAFSLLVPLAGLVRIRLTQHAQPGVSARQTSNLPQNLRRQDLLAGIRFTLPVAAAILASLVLVIRAERGLTSVLPPATPLLIALGLAGAGAGAPGPRRWWKMSGCAESGKRPCAKPQRRWRPSWAWRGHELKKPLASMKLGLQVVEHAHPPPEPARTVGRYRYLRPSWGQVAQAERQEDRLDRLVNDLVDMSRIRAGLLEFHLEPTDLHPLSARPLRSSAR